MNIFSVFVFYGDQFYGEYENWSSMPISNLPTDVIIYYPIGMYKWYDIHGDGINKEDVPKTIRVLASLL